jgi:hypothetical protein
MLPMAIAYFTGHHSLVVPFGQGGFFYSMMPLPALRAGRVINLFILLGVGMGFYLVGANIVHNLWLSLFVTYIVVLLALFDRIRRVRVQRHNEVKRQRDEHSQAKEL